MNKTASPVASPQPLRPSHLKASIPLKPAPTEAEILAAAKVILSHRMGSIWHHVNQAEQELIQLGGVAPEGSEIDRAMNRTLESFQAFDEERVRLAVLLNVDASAARVEQPAPAIQAQSEDTRHDPAARLGEALMGLAKVDSAVTTYHGWVEELLARIHASVYSAMRPGNELDELIESLTLAGDVEAALHERAEAAIAKMLSVVDPHGNDPKPSAAIAP